MFPAMGLGIDKADTSLDDLLKKLQQTGGTGQGQQGNALSALVGGAAAPDPNSLESQFGGSVDALPKLPSGDFYLPAANGGPNQLVPLTNGQPTATFDDANRRDAFGGVAPKGQFPSDMAPNIVTGVNSIPMPNAPTWMGSANAGVSKGAAAGQDSSDKGGDPLASLLAGTTAPASAGASPLDSLIGNKTAMANMPAGGFTMPAGVDSGAGKFQLMPDGSLRNVNNPAQEAAANTTYAIQAAGGNPAQANAILQQILGSGDEKFKAEQAALARGGQTDIQKLANQGHLAVAQEASRAQQLTGLDQMEAHIRDAVGKGMVDKLTAQAQLDFINQRRASLAQNLGAPGGTPGQSSPPGAGGKSGTMSPPITAGADIAQLRNLFGTTGPTGQWQANPQVTGANISQLIDKATPDQIPQIAAAIKAGTFGDVSSLRNASLNSLAQNYLMSQGRLPGGVNPAAQALGAINPLAPKVAGGMPGSYTIPVDQNGKQVPLMTLLQTPPSNALGTLSQKAQVASSGIPYDTIQLPDGTKIPFDASGIQGLSTPASALGYNQNKLQMAGQRVNPLAQLILELQSSGKTPGSP